MQQLQATFHDIDVRIGSEDPLTIVVSDVAKALGYRDANTIKRSIKDKYLGTRTVRTPGGPQQMTCVTRPGLSQALATLRPQDPAKRKKVEAFQDWLYEEVLEQIYETGTYTVPSAAPSGDGAPSMLDVAEQLIGALRKQEQKIQELRTRQDRTDHEQEQLAERIDDLEAQRAQPATPTTRYGHEVQGHTWDGMRRQVNALVKSNQQQTGNSYNAVYRYLYDSTERGFGFHPSRLQKRRGGKTAIQSLDFDEMRALLEVAQWLFGEPQSASL